MQGVFSQKWPFTLPLHPFVRLSLHGTDFQGLHPTSPEKFANRAALILHGHTARHASALTVVPLSLTLRSRGSDPVLL
jgi:hypothetical protein